MLRAETVAQMVSSAEEGNMDRLRPEAGVADWGLHLESRLTIQTISKKSLHEQYAETPRQTNGESAT